MRPSAVPSAYPDGGHTRIADDLLDALIAFPLSKRQYKVVLAVIRKTYGYGKREDDLSSTQLAELTGLADSHCRAAVRDLGALRVLTVSPGRFGQVLAINPDHRAWIVPEQPDQNGPQAGPNRSVADQSSPATRTKTDRPAGPKRSAQKTTPIDNPKTPQAPPAGGRQGRGIPRGKPTGRAAVRERCPPDPAGPRRERSPRRSPRCPLPSQPGSGPSSSSTAGRCGRP